MSWFNEDGLLLKYGTEKGVSNKAGEYRFDGPLHMIEFTLDLTSAAADPTVMPGTDQVSFPANAIVEKVEIVATEAAVGSGSVLNIGLIKRDRSTEIDYEAFVKALPTASMDTIGETTVLTKGVSYAGDLVGTTVGANPGYLTVDYTTAAFTDGTIRGRIYYRFS